MRRSISDRPMVAEAGVVDSVLAAPAWAGIPRISHED
jgi:hypothetical protein